MSGWCKTMTNKGWRVFPLSVHGPYVKSLGPDVGPTEPVEKVHIDMPGMVMVDRSYQKIELDGLTIEMPSQDFPVMYEQLSRTKEEILPGGLSVIKLRGWIAGIVMLPVQRERLLRTMGEMLPAVRLIAQKENEEFARRIRSINESSGARIVSARAEMIEQNGSGDDKPN